MLLDPILLHLYFIAEWINKCKCNKTGMQNCERLKGMCVKPKAKISTFRKKNEYEAVPILAHIQFMFLESQETICIFWEKRFRSPAFHSGFAAAVSHFSNRSSQTDRGLMLFPSFSSSSHLLYSCGALAVPVSSAYGNTQEIYTHHTYNLRHP